MQFGIFGSAQANSSNLGSGVGQGFDEYIEYNIEAEALGYYSTFLVEHHFTGWSQVSSTLNLLTWLASRTSSLRVGTAVLVLPWHNPVLLAEQVATLDLLSKGRLDFGIGKGYRHNEFNGFCIPQEEAEARFEESLKLLIKSWTSKERFSFEGKFFKFQDIIVEPSPWTKPHPPIWMAAGSKESICKVADRGFNLLLDQFASPELLSERITLFKTEVERRGRVFNPLEIAVARDVFVAKNEDDKQAAHQRHRAFRDRVLAVSLAPGQTTGAHILSYQKESDRAQDQTLFGTPDEINEKLEELKKVGVNYILCNSTGSTRDSMRRFAKELMCEYV